MKLTVSLEHRFARTPDGDVWSKNVFAYDVWRRYLTVFDEIRVIARIQDVSELGPELRRASGEGVEFVGIPYYHGFSDYLRMRRKVRVAVRSAYEGSSAYICRVPSQIGACLIPLLRQQGHPYAVEVVGDPWDVFAAGASTHPLRPIFRRVFAHRLRQQCQYACAAAYVTEFVLQKRYPPAPGAFTTHYSSIELPPEAFADQPREPRPATQRRRIISVGSLDQMYKAPDVLIDAVAQCVQQGLDLELVWIGDGKHRVEMEQRARDRGLPLGDRMHFLGQLPAGPAIRDELDQADIFVLASRTEGLPRVIIEAMARGLPCVGSNVGGIPELLPPMRLFQPNDVVTLRNILWNVLGDREALSQMSNQNLQKARAYSSHVLNERRRTFYEEVLNASFAK